MPDVRGGRRTHFWRDVRESTRLGRVTDTEGVMGIGEALFRQKLVGSVTRPVAAGALTLPIHPETHGRPRESGLRQRPAVTHSPPA